jgi:hypothetical protein
LELRERAASAKKPDMQVGVRFAFCFAVLTTAHAHAQDDGDEPPPSTASAAAAAGNFMPFVESARGDTQRAFVATQGGYDSVRDSGVLRATAQARVYGRLSARGSVRYGEAEEKRVQPELGLKLDGLYQERHGLDLAVAASYEPEGFNTTPAASLRIALARSFGATQLVGNVGYGASLDGERHGEARLGLLHAVLPDLRLGLDSRFRIDLERDDDEPAGEPDWDLAAGPTASYVLGPVVLSASGGASALKLRFADTHVGAFGSIGLGAAF